MATTGESEGRLDRQHANALGSEARPGENWAILEQLFESSPDAILTTNGEGAITRVNGQVEKLFGYRREELLGQPVETLLPERFRGGHAAHREAYRAQPRVRSMGAGLELYGRRKDGSEFPVDIMLGPIETEAGPLVLAVVRDITDRKRAENALRQSEERLRQIAENVREVLFVMDFRGSGTLLYVSPAYEKIWGRSCQSLYEHPMAWFEAIHPEDRERLAPAMERFLADGVFEEEYRVVRPDGSIRWVWDRSVPVQDATGAVVRAVGIAEDITDRKEAEDALRLSEQRFRSLVEGVKDYAIFLLDPEGRVASWSPGAERINGYRADEIVGQHFSRFYTPEDALRDKPARELKSAVAQGRFEEEGWRVRKDGTRFWANVVVTALKDQSGKVRGFVKVTRDFTERKKAEGAVLLELTNVMVSNLDIRRLLSAISAGIRQVVPYDFASVALFDPAIGKLRVQVLDTSFGKDLPPADLILPLADNPAGWTFTSREPLVLERLDATRFPAAALRHLTTQGVQSACWMPLISRARVLGALAIGRHQPGAFSEKDLNLLSQVSNQVALALDNADAFRQIAELKDRLAEEKLYLEEELRTEYNFDEIVGESAALKRVLKEVETVAPADATVLVQGETGTGKELIARAIHRLSTRRDHTFVKLNCAAIPSGLLESELFGHEKGAFTGAIMQKIGRLELAHEGTLFLDEVGDIPLEIQPKLLRALQEKEFERLGSTRTIPVDVRLVAATNRDLARMVEERQFRSDLYYRLKVFPITVPPLRERPEDIPLLVHYFAQRHAQRMNKRIDTIPSEAMNVLTHWSWPGNVRELENLLERAVILSRGPVLQVPLAELKSLAEPAPVAESVGDPPSGNGGATLEAKEREHILRVLRETHGVIAGPTGAAARLGLKRTTLNSKMRKLGITRADFAPR
ncbi:MAG TPA: PAS domain S-box protein [Terriglobia bacterium]|nr:PAS domain S-box protein [Terriglobia bacterium]